MAILSFQMPEKVIMEKSDDFTGAFTFKPLEKGYGVTVGNALRRILLSSLEGYAISAIRIPSVLHEFSTINGVIEDVTEIILNLKQVRFKKVGEIEETKILVQISGQDTFKAADIQKFSSAYHITNPDLVICHLDPSVNFEIEISMSKGRGWVPAEENRTSDMAFGAIAIDSIFTPIVNVQYFTEDLRVEQRTDFQKLTINVTTDGTIHPEEALKQAAYILIQHAMLFSDKNITFESTKHEEENVVDEHVLHMRKLLKTNIADLDLSVRAYNCLKAANIKSLGDLVALDVSDMMKFRNFGKKSLAELEQLLIEKNLSFGLDISKYKLDED